MQLATRRLLPALLTLLAATAPTLAASIPAADSGNSLETRQFHLDNARVPGAVTSHQTVTAWQVTQGSWNGQTLDGLSIVLVHSTPESGQTAAQTNCYISQEATPAQREALLMAFFATQPQLLALQPNLRIEPAVISVEIDGQTVVLHLGLIA